MKSKKITRTASTAAILVLLAAGVHAAETTKPETTTTTTSTSTAPTPQPTNSENEIGECWVWPHCIVIN